MANMKNPFSMWKTSFFPIHICQIKHWQLNHFIAIPIWLKIHGKMIFFFWLILKNISPCLTKLYSWRQTDNAGSVCSSAHCAVVMSIWNNNNTITDAADAQAAVQRQFLYCCALWSWNWNISNISNCNMLSAENIRKYFTNKQITSWLAARIRKGFSVDHFIWSDAQAINIINMSIK